MFKHLKIEKLSQNPLQPRPEIIQFIVIDSMRQVIILPELQFRVGNAEGRV